MIAFVRKAFQGLPHHILWAAVQGSYYLQIQDCQDQAHSVLVKTRQNLFRALTRIRWPGPGKNKTKLVPSPHKDTLAKDLHTKFYQELPTDTRHSNIMYSLLFFISLLYISTFIIASYNPSWISYRHVYYL